MKHCLKGSEYLGHTDPKHGDRVTEASVPFQYPDDEPEIVEEVKPQKDHSKAFKRIFGAFMDYIDDLDNRDIQILLALFIDDEIIPAKIANKLGMTRQAVFNRMEYIKYHYPIIYGRALNKSVVVVYRDKQIAKKKRRQKRLSNKVTPMLPGIK